MKLQKWLIIIILLGGFVFSGLLYFYLKNLQIKDMTESFLIASEERFATFSDTLDLDINIIEGIRSFYNASKEVDRSEFTVFTQSSIQKELAVQSLEWIPVIPEKKRSAFEQKAQQEGLLAFNIKEKDSQGTLRVASQRDIYFPIYFAEPYEKNTSVFGYDLGSEPAERAALLKAMKTNTLTVTSRKLGQKNVMAAYLPVYSKEILHQRLQNYQPHIQGFISGVFLLENLFEKSIQSLTPQGIHTYIYDVTEEDAPQFLYGHYSRTSKQIKQYVDPVAYKGLIQGKYISFHDLPIGGRTWRMIFVPTAGYIAFHLDGMPLIFFIIGLFNTMVVALVYYKSWEYTEHVEEKVKERTDDLHKANENLKGKIDTIAEQNEQLEKTKKATINILEDLEFSKDALEKSNQLLADQKKDLEKVNLELDRFTYTASHDLRAPLRAISSFASFLKEDYEEKLDEEGKDYIAEICNGAEQMTRLIDDLLSLSRISRIKNPYEQVNINDLVDSIRERINFDIKENKVDFQMDEKLPTIICDRIKMGEVFLNLINNAIKFSSKDNKSQPKVEVGSKEIQGGYEFFVKDNGIGIDPQFHDQVFDLFKRLQKDRDYEGTGAGLSIVKRIIDDHNGRVWVESSLGEGSVFKFYIPNNLKINKDTENDMISSELPEFTGEI